MILIIKAMIICIQCLCLCVFTEQTKTQRTEERRGKGRKNEKFLLRKCQTLIWDLPIKKFFKRQNKHLQF